jgi:hypothetical protein
MEFDISHRIDRVVSLYDALWAERFSAPARVSLGGAVAAACALLLWPGARIASAAICSACALAAAVAWWIRSTTRQQVQRQFDELRLAHMRYRVLEEGLSESSAAGNCLLRWHALAPPRELAGFLVVPRRPIDSNNLIALPLDQLSAEARRAIEDRIGRAAATPVG